ncbi:hypothetical protein HDE_06700 [Halotydeus destructor]|nr:hypothetical protein HDE_06700 [Halotydeus destructor]
MWKVIFIGLICVIVATSGNPVSRVDDNLKNKFKRSADDDNQVKTSADDFKDKGIAVANLVLMEAKKLQNQLTVQLKDVASSATSAAMDEIGNWFG